MARPDAGLCWLVRVCVRVRVRVCASRCGLVRPDAGLCWRVRVGARACVRACACGRAWGRGHQGRGVGTRSGDEDIALDF